MCNKNEESALACVYMVSMKKKNAKIERKMHGEKIHAPERNGYRWYAGSCSPLGRRAPPLLDGPPAEEEDGPATP